MDAEQLPAPERVSGAKRKRAESDAESGAKSAENARPAYRGRKGQNVGRPDEQPASAPARDPAAIAAPRGPRGKKGKRFVERKADLLSLAEGIIAKAESASATRLHHDETRVATFERKSTDRQAERAAKKAARDAARQRALAEAKAAALAEKEAAAEDARARAKADRAEAAFRGAASRR